MNSSYENNNKRFPINKAPNSNGNKRGLLFLIFSLILIIGPLILTNKFFEGATVPEIENDEAIEDVEDNLTQNTTKVLESNVNGNYDIKIEGKGNSDSGSNYLDTTLIFFNNIPKYNYGTSSIEILPKYNYKTYYANPVVPQITKSTPQEISIPNYGLDTYISNLEINTSSVEYTTKLSDYQNVVNAKQISLIGNRISPAPENNKQIQGFEDNDYSNYGIWSEAMCDIYESLPSVEVTVDVAIEIINQDHSLQYEDYWDLLSHYYNLTLESIWSQQLPTNKIAVGSLCEWNASLMYRTNDGSDYAYTFNHILKPDNITTQDILGGYDNIYPFSPHYNYENRNIDANDIDIQEGMNITEEMFNNYSITQGYQNNFGNPIITFRFRASASGLVADVDVWEDPVSWVKIKINEFDTKHTFKWDYLQDGNFNSIQDIYVKYDQTNHFLSSSCYSNLNQGWENRIAVFTVENLPIIYLDSNNIYESIIVNINWARAKVYKPISTTQSDLTICSVLMTRNINNWTISTDNLTNEIYYDDSGSNSQVIFVLTASNWDAPNYLGYIYEYHINFAYFSLITTGIYSQGEGAVEIEVDNSYSRQINIEWKNATFEGNFMAQLNKSILSWAWNSDEQQWGWNGPESDETENLMFNFKNYDNSAPQYEIRLENLNANWSSGSTKNKLKFEWKMDHYVPIIGSYEVVNQLNGDESKTFGMITRDELIYGSEAVRNGLVIMQNTHSLENRSFTLTKIKPLEFEREINFNELPVGIYNVWYSALDMAGNYLCTEQFALNVSGNNLMPKPFDLSSNADSPDPDGNFSISWTQSFLAVNYSIFKNGSYLVASGLTSLSYEFVNHEDGPAEYQIIAYNIYGNCSSNPLELYVGKVPLIFSISTDAEFPELDDSFIIYWEASDNAKTYTLIQISGSINGTESLIVENIVELQYSLSDYTTGTYYFKVIAYNEFGNFTSNVVKVVVVIQEEQKEEEKKESKIEFSSFVYLGIGIVSVALGIVVVVYFVNKRENIKDRQLDFKNYM